MSKRNFGHHASANGLLEEMIQQDVKYWKKRCNDPCQDCYLIRCGRKVDKIHEHYRKIGSDYCTSVFSIHKEDGLNTDRRKSKNGCVNDMQTTPTIDSFSETSLAITPTEQDLYVDVMRCCKEPTLATKENITVPKDKFRCDSDRLNHFARKIFQLDPRRHEQYQHLIRTGTQEESLRMQQHLLETNSNPFYNESNFETFMEYRNWQDSERSEISNLLETSKSPPPQRRYNAPAKDRRDQYKQLASKVIRHDLDTSTKLGCANFVSNTTGKDVLRFRRKYGKRLLGEFAERFRVSKMSRLCCHLEVLSGHLPLDTLKCNVAVMLWVNNEIICITDLLNRGDSMCLSEKQSICDIADNFVERARNLVINLLTDWLPSSKCLDLTLELVKNAYILLDLLGEEAVDWAECFSKWLHCAIKHKYQSYKEINTEYATELFFSSVEYAIDVLKLLKQKRHNEDDSSYECVLNKYIPDFVEVYTHSIYESFESDESVLAQTLTSGISVQGNQRGGEALNLRDMALSYKLAEFDSIGNIGRAKRPHFSWRIAYHPVAMHWLDVLSCHMRRQVNDVVNLDSYRGAERAAENARISRQKNRLVNSCNIQTTSLITAKVRNRTRNYAHFKTAYLKKDTDSSSDSDDARANFRTSCEQSFSRTQTNPTFATCAVNPAPKNAIAMQDIPCSSSDYSSDSSTDEIDESDKETADNVTTLPDMVDENFNGIGAGFSSESLSLEDDNNNESHANSERDVLATITTSLADFTSIMTRFIQVVKDVTMTIYVLPHRQPGMDSELLDGEMSLKRHKNHFLPKAVEALCYAARQYAFLIFRKELGRDAANAIFKRQTLEESILHSIEINTTNLNVDQIFRYFNNLLVLESGLPYAIHLLESLTDGLSEAGSRPSTGSGSEHSAVFSSGSEENTSSDDESGLDETNGLWVLSIHLKGKIKQILDQSIKGLGDVIVQSATNKFSRLFSNLMQRLPMTRHHFDRDVDEIATCLEKLVTNVSRQCYEEGVALLYRRLWFSIMQNFHINTRIHALSGRLQYRVQCRYLLQVFGFVANTFSKLLIHHGIDPLLVMNLDQIQPTLETLELMSMPTPALISMLLVSQTELHEADSFVNSCVSKLRNQKSFTGAELLAVISEVNRAKRSSSSDSDLEICKNLLSSDIVKFLFRRRRPVNLPDVISVDMDNVTGKARSDSINTGSSLESSVHTDDTDSCESNASELERIFRPDNRTVYRFTDKARMFPVIWLQDNPQNHCRHTGVIRVLRYKSHSDNVARDFLWKNKRRPRSWLPCLK